jgi:hypothetical protein
MTIALVEPNLSSGPVQTTRPTLLFAIPPGDNSKFFATHIPWEGQKEIRALLHTLQIIHKSDNLQKACERLSATLQRKGKKRGLSAERLRKHYINYRKTGDWRVLWNKAKYPEQKAGLPEKFIKFWKKLCEDHQRVCAQAHRELVKIWETHFDSNGTRHDAIPGYDTWPEKATFTDLPEGWTYENLMRHAPDQFERTAARIGRSAAAAFRLPVLTHRVGLRVGEYFQFDDHEYNVKVNFPGQWKAMRPRGFTAADVLSGCFFRQSFKPTLWDEVEEKKRVLSERDMMWFVIDVLTEVGFRNDERGTKLVVEHGTAAIREAFEQRIYDVTGGKVTVQRSGKFGRPAHKGQFEGRSHGNFRFKALIESGFNIIDNYLCGLPGQVGKDRLHAPEQLHGIDGYNNKLLKAATGMTPERAAQLKFPVLLWHEFTDRALDAYAAINRTHDHDLKDWDKLRFYAKEWRLPLEGGGFSEWRSPAALLAMTPDEQNAVAALLQQSPELLTRTRKLSRQEVFDAGKDELTRVPYYELPALLGYEPGFGKVLNVTDKGLFRFEDQEYGSGEFIYIAVDAAKKRLTGEFLCFINPHNPTYLVACRDNRVVAVCPAYETACLNDVPGMQKLMGQQAQWEANALAEQRERHEPDARALDAMKRHNEALIKGAPVTAAEKAEVARIVENAIPLTELPTNLPAESLEDTDSDAQSDALSKLLGKQK